MEVDPCEMCACADRIQKRARGGPRGSGGNEADPVPPFRSEDVAASEMDPTYLDGHSGGRRHASCDLIHFLSLLRPVPLRQHLPDHVAGHVTTSILVSEVARGFRDGPSMSPPWSKCRVQRRWGACSTKQFVWVRYTTNTHWNTSLHFRRPCPDKFQQPANIQWPTPRAGWPGRRGRDRQRQLHVRGSWGQGDLITG
jgi:hypothetical protein